MYDDRDDADDGNGVKVAAVFRREEKRYQRHSITIQKNRYPIYFLHFCQFQCTHTTPHPYIM